MPPKKQGNAKVKALLESREAKEFYTQAKLLNLDFLLVVSKKGGGTPMAEGTMSFGYLCEALDAGLVPPVREPLSLPVQPMPMDILSLGKNLDTLRSYCTALKKVFLPERKGTLGL